MFILSSKEIFDLRKQLFAAYTITFNFIKCEELYSEWDHSASSKVKQSCISISDLLYLENSFLIFKFFNWLDF